MALRPEDLPKDPALLTEFTLALAAKNEVLLATVDRLQRLIFGARSERMQVVLAEQLALELGDLATGTKPVAANDDTAGSAKPESQAARKKPNRNIGALPKDLPRVDVTIEPETTICGCCAGKLHRIGEDESEVLDRIPAVLRVVRTIRPKYVCRSCDDGIVQAPAPPRLIEGGMVSTALVSHIAVAKYGWYSTLYRQMQILGLVGVPVDRSTLARWMKHMAWMLKGLYQLQLTQMHSYPRLFCDETPMPVIEPGRPHTKTCQFWTHATDDRPWGGPAPTAVAYVFAQGRGKKEIASQLAGFEGVLQVDGYAAYGSLARDQRTAGKIRLAFCLTHARRKFVDVHKTTNSPFAREVIERLADVYAIEKEIRGTTAANRRAVRQAETKPIMEALHARMVAVNAGLSKISTLHEAIEYTLTHWAGLTMFIDDGRLEPDTNTVERNIRPIATRESLCTPSLSVWKHWKLIFGGQVTRAAFTPDRRRYRWCGKVGGEDLERRTGNDLLGAKQAGFNQLAYSVAGDAVLLCRLAQGQPSSILLGGFIRVNGADPTDRADPVCRPGFALACWQSHTVESRGDILVRPAARHAANDRQSLVGGAAVMFAGLGFTKAEFGVLPALPMDDQDNLPSLVVDVDGDLIDESTRQLLAGAHIDIGVFPRRLKVLGNAGQFRNCRRPRGGGGRRVKTRLALAYAA